MVGRTAQRVGYGALAIATLVALFLLDAVIAQEQGQWEGVFGDLLRCGSVIPLFFLAVLLSAGIEMDRLLRATGARPHRPFALVMIAAVFLAPWLSAAGWLGLDVSSMEGLYWPLAAVVATLLGAGACQVLRGRPDGAFRDIGGTVAMVLYLGFLASFTLQIRCGQDTRGEEGVWLLLITLLVTKASDIGAYLVGSRFGKHKLSPHISPGKSVEGTAAGLITSAAAAVLFVSALPIAAASGLPSDAIDLIDEVTRSFRGEGTSAGPKPWFRAVLFGLAMSASGQFGDLVESCFKRDAGIKDSGRIMPEYGGILDLIDSPVFAVPVAWFLLSVVWDVV